MGGRRDSEHSTQDVLQGQMAETNWSRKAMEEVAMKRTRLKPMSDKRRRDNVERAAMMEEKYGPRPWECLFWDFVDGSEMAKFSMPAVLQGAVLCHGDV